MHLANSLCINRYCSYPCSTNKKTVSDLKESESRSQCLSSLEEENSALVSLKSIGSFREHIVEDVPQLLEENFFVPINIFDGLSTF